MDENCPEQYNKLIKIENKCIDDCSKDEIYKYDYKNACYQECPYGTFKNETNYICYENYNDINTDDIIKVKIDENINKYRNEFVSHFNVNETKEDIIENEESLVFQMTTTDNQKNNTIKNLSTIDLGLCETRLKTVYSIDQSLPLIIFKIDYFSPDSLIPIIGYEIYHPITKEKLDLSHCKDILIKLNIPVNIDESKLYKYDPNSGFYTDNCFTYTSENGTDVILDDRKQEYSNNNLALCESNCNYTGYDVDNKQSSCNCYVKNKANLISEIMEKPVNSNLDKEKSESSSKSSSGSSNIISIKCTKTLFSKEGLKNNISSYILLIFIGQFLISIILFVKCGYRLLNDKINKILREKEKANEKNNRIIVSTRGDKDKNKNNFGKKKFQFPPKKQNVNYIKIKNIHKGNINIKSGAKNILVKSKSTRKNRNIIKTKIINSKIKSSKSKTLKSKKSLIKIKQSHKLSYNDYELNNFDYSQTILYDKRSCFNYYFSLIKRKIPLIFYFCPVDDYNSRIIKLCIFSLSFSIYYAINFAFFDNKIMHKIYEIGGKYDIIFFLPKIVISFAASYYITDIIKFIFLSERNISNIRCQIILSVAYRISDKEKKNMIIKYTIFFISGIIFLGFFWILLSSFGAVYPNTQIFIFKNTLISFAMSFFYPIFINIFPCIFRMCALNSNKKSQRCIYNFSKFLKVL